MAENTGNSERVEITGSININAEKPLNIITEKPLNIVSEINKPVNVAATLSELPLRIKIESFPSTGSTSSFGLTSNTVVTNTSVSPVYSHITNTVESHITNTVDSHVTNTVESHITNTVNTYSTNTKQSPVYGYVTNIVGTYSTNTVESPVYTYVPNIVNSHVTNIVNSIITKPVETVLTETEQHFILETARRLYVNINFLDLSKYGIYHINPSEYARASISRARDFYMIAKEAGLTNCLINDKNI